jgi:hypothetical protein
MIAIRAAEPRDASDSSRVIVPDEVSDDMDTSFMVTWWAELTCTPKTGPAIMRVLRSTKGDCHAQAPLQRGPDHRHAPRT